MLGTLFFYDKKCYNFTMMKEKTAIKVASALSVLGILFFVLLWVWFNREEEKIERLSSWWLDQVESKEDFLIDLHREKDDTGVTITGYIEQADNEMVRIQAHLVLCDEKTGELFLLPTKIQIFGEHPDFDFPDIYTRHAVFMAHVPRAAGPIDTGKNMYKLYLYTVYNWTEHLISLDETL